jgi:hypothetical protein
VKILRRIGRLALIAILAVHLWPVADAVAFCDALWTEA